MDGKGSYNKRLEDIVAENLKSWPSRNVKRVVYPADASRKKKRRNRRKMTARQAVKRSLA